MANGENGHRGGLAFGAGSNANGGGLALDGGVAHPGCNIAIDPDCFNSLPWPFPLVAIQSNSGGRSRTNL